MPAPFPPEAVAGAVKDPAESEAQNLYSQYAWLARLSDEMDAEAELDLKRVMQFVFHSRKFRVWLDALQARIGNGHTQVQIGDLIASWFAFKKCTWATRNAMNTDLQAIYGDAGTVEAWADANAAQYKDGFSVNKVVSPEVTTDDPVKVAKSPAVATFLTNFRARFGAKP